MKDFSKEYLSLLTGKYKDINLTRITNEQEFFEKQILDSLYPTEIFDIFNSDLENGLHIDVGFGGGFPLVPLAWKYRESQFIGFEARRKKVNVVSQIAEDLNLLNVRTFHNRIENLFIDVKSSISFKAVGKIEDFLKKINTIKGNRVYFYKGPNLSELEVVPTELENFRLIENSSYNMTGTLGRTFVIYEAINVPRGTNKNLVKVSSFI